MFIVPPPHVLAHHGGAVMSLPPCAIWGGGMLPAYTARRHCVRMLRLLLISCLSLVPVAAIQASPTANGRVQMDMELDVDSLSFK